MTLSTVCVTVTRTQCVAGMNEIRGSVCVFYYITRLLFLHPGHAQCACTRARHSPCGRWNRSVLPAAPGVSPPAAAIRSPFIIPQICSWLTASQYLFVCYDSVPAACSHGACLCPLRQRGASQAVLGGAERPVLVVTD